MRFFINKGFEFNDISEITKKLLENDKIKGSYCNSLLNFCVQEIDGISKLTAHNLKNWHQLKVLEDQFEVLAQLAITDENMVEDVVEKIAHIYACSDSNLLKIHQWEIFRKS